MSLSDIVQFVGTGSVPVVVAGSVLGVFELGEKLASQRAKDVLSKWLLTFDVRKAEALPDGTRELFERIFGERHFSLKCFVRSVAFSLGAMAFIAILILLLYPIKTLQLATVLFEKSFYFPYGIWMIVILWLPWSLLIDYISLFKTRLILNILTRLRRAIKTVAVGILSLDYILYIVLFQIGIGLLIKAIMYITYLSLSPDTQDNLRLVIYFRYFNYNIELIPSSFSPPSSVLYSIFFWSGFAPSLWMWLYVLALFVTRALLRSERLVNWLRWFLDIEKNPFRSIGAVAAALAFIATVAILLVSAEVSRISRAA